MGELVRHLTSWETRDGTLRKEYIAVSGRIGLSELIDQLVAMAPEVARLDGFQLNFATVTWTREATEEELAERQRANDASDARHQEWESRFMRHLINKYGEDTSRWPAMSTEDFAEYKRTNPRAFQVP